MQNSITKSIKIEGWKIARARSVGRPRLIVNECMSPILVVDPIYQCNVNRVVSVHGHSVFRVVISGSMQKSMGCTSRCPYPIAFPLHNGREHSAGVLMILLNELFLSVIAKLQSGAVNAVDIQDVGDRPRVVERLDGENRCFYKLSHVLGHHAFVSGCRVGFHTASNGRINFDV